MALQHSYKLTISSHDRDRTKLSESASNFTLMTNLSDHKQFRMTTVKVNSVQIPNVLPNVYPDSTFVYLLNGVETTYTINTPQAVHMDSDTLIATINSEMVGIFSLSPDIYGHTLLTQEGASTVSVAAADRKSNKLAFLLGFDQQSGSEATTTLGSNITAPFQPKMNAETYCVHIQSRAFGRRAYEHTKQGYSSDIFHLCTVPITTAYGTYVHYSPEFGSSTNKWYNQPKPLRNELDFQLRNPYGEIIDLGDHEWSITLSILYE